MARYIDADKLSSHFEKVAKYFDGDAFQLGMDAARDIVSNFPAADVAEVKHGEWVDKYNNKYDNHLYECSACGDKALYEAYENELGQTKLRQVLSDYCPNCGAKMDGGEVK